MCARSTHTMKQYVRSSPLWSCCITNLPFINTRVYCCTFNAVRSFMMWKYPDGHAYAGVWMYFHPMDNSVSCIFYWPWNAMHICVYMHVYTCLCIANIQGSCVIGKNRPLVINILLIIIVWLCVSIFIQCHLLFVIITRPNDSLIREQIWNNLALLLI